MKQRERCVADFATDPAMLYRQVAMGNGCHCAAWHGDLAETQNSNPGFFLIHIHDATLTLPQSPGPQYTRENGDWLVVHNQIPPVPDDTIC